MKSLFYILFSLLAITFFSCSTDVDLNDDWQDNTIVFGLLNTTDTVHYIRIGKSFLGDENAYVMATHSDSIQYSDTLEVKVERWLNNNLLETINFYATDPYEVLKDTGIFAADNYFVYKSTANLIPEGEYRLSIYIPSLDKTVRSSTYLIEKIDFKGYTSNLFFGKVHFASDDEIKLEWTTPKHARLFNVTLVFHYSEVTNLKDTVKKSISWSLQAKISISADGGENMKYPITRVDFYKFVATKLDEIPVNVRRIAGKVDFILDIGSDDFKLYYDINQPATGIVQERPIFTNIDNGIGIFTSSYTKREYWEKGLTAKSIDLLACGEYTGHLNFVDSEGKFRDCN